MLPEQPRFPDYQSERIQRACQRRKIHVQDMRTGCRVRKKSVKAGKTVTVRNFIGIAPNSKVIRKSFYFFFSFLTLGAFSFLTLGALTFWGFSFFGLAVAV